MSQAARINITPSLPRALPPAARAKVHTAIEAHLAAVEAMTAFLDTTDGDPDHEEGGDSEPSLASINPSFSDPSACASREPRLDQSFWAHGGDDDREAECEDEGADEHYYQGGAL